jgi:hypothetical protein
MSLFHIVGQITWYSFVALMFLGAYFEFREHRKPLRSRTPNVGRKLGRLQKHYRQGATLKTSAMVRREYRANEQAKVQRKFDWSGK